jgi:isopentenyl diphosphate isomerase/L-lactate dehydrogenase-like FMN-dependent dehydrogenase
MNRRFFSQLIAPLIALGAGLFSTSAVAVDDEEDVAAGATPGKPSNSTGFSGTVTVNDFVASAEAKLPQASFDYVTTGSEDEVTLHDNVEAFRRIRVLPPLLHGVNKADLSTTVLGQKVSMPILLAPVAALRMLHPQGVLASARAAARAGTICAASSSALNSVEEIAAAGNGPKWFQVYVPRERTVARKLVSRAEAAGFQAIVVTVDLGERKDADLRNQFTVPKEMLLKHLRDIGFSNLSEQNSHDELSKFNAAAWEVSLNVDFFKWLRGATKLPILIKGVLSPDAARQAIDLGLDGIVVSNHGGRRLDGMPASIDVLGEVAEAVNGKIEILLDGGIRRGGDVMKALALGAKAVLIGRPQAWALAAGGEAGVTRVLEILRDELTNAMVASGCATVQDIKPSLLR